MHAIIMSVQPQKNKYVMVRTTAHIFVNQDHPSTLKLIETLQTECAHVTGVLIQDKHGINIIRLKKKQERYTQNI